MGVPPREGAGHHRRVKIYDAATGVRLWGWAGSYYPSAGRIAVGGSTLVVAEDPCGSLDGQDLLTALDTATGRQLWQRVSFWPPSALTVGDGFVMTGGTCGGCQSDFSDGTDVFRIRDGETAWYSYFKIPAGPVVARGRVLLANHGHFVPGWSAEPGWTAVDVRTGKRLWSTTIPVTGLKAADASGNYFYLADAKGLRMVASATGRPVWRRTDGRVGDVAVDDRRVYASMAGKVSAYDWKSGRLLWSRAMTAPERPVRAGDLLYVHTGSAVAILSPADGSTVTLSTALRPMTEHVVVAGGRLYVTDGRSIRAYAP